MRKIRDAYVNRLIGKPWQINGTGRPGYDCLTLVRRVYSDHGITLPPWPYNVDNWEAQAEVNMLRVAGQVFGQVNVDPQALDFVIIGRVHCGVMIDDARVLNCDERRGVFSITLKRFSSPLWIGRMRGRRG